MNRGLLKHRRFEILVSLVLLLAVLAVFSQTVTFDFVDYDDPQNISENPYVRDGFSLRSIRWAFSSGGKLGDYNPLTWLSHMLDCEIYGLAAGGHHLTNVFFHVANSVLLFLVFRLMTGALWRSAFVAALFAVHPLHVESVAWVTERRDVLYTFFWILTIAAYVRYARCPNSVFRYITVLFAFAAALLSKSMAVTLPFVLLLLDYWPLERVSFGHMHTTSNLKNEYKKNIRRESLFRLVFEKIPFFMMSVVVSIITYIVNQNTGAISIADKLGIVVRMNNALVSYVKYIMMMIRPSKLAVLYPHLGSDLPIWQPIAAALALLAISIWVIRLARSRRYLPVGWFWYIGTLVPAIGIIQAGAQAMADRYTYVPLTGLFIIIAWGLPELLAKWRYRKVVLGTSTLIILLVLSVCTWFQVGLWRNSVTLFEHTLEVTSDNCRMHNNLGRALQLQGKLDEAISHFLQALRIRYDDAVAHRNLAEALQSQDKLDEAIKHYRQAVQFEPDDIDANYGLGNMLQSQGRLDEAITHYRRVLQFKPEHTEAHNNLGNVLLSQGKLDEAISHYRQVLHIKPNEAPVHYNLGNVLLSQGRLDEAIEHYRWTLRIKPDFADVHNNLGAALAQQGKYDEAITHLKEVVKLNPNSADAHLSLARVLESEGRIDEAITHYKEALRLKPDWLSLMNNLAWLLATHKETEFHNPKEAVRLAERACELTNYQEPSVLDTLAAAYAAAARFPEAVTTAEKALDMAQSSGQNQLKEKIQNHLRLYKAGQPHIEPLPEVFSD